MFNQKIKKGLVFRPAPMGQKSRWINGRSRGWRRRRRDRTWRWCHQQRSRSHQTRLRAWADGDERALNTTVTPETLGWRYSYLLTLILKYARCPAVTAAVWHRERFPGTACQSPSRMLPSPGLRAGVQAGRPPSGEEGAVGPATEISSSRTSPLFTLPRLDRGILSRLPKRIAR